MKNLLKLENEYMHRICESQIRYLWVVDVSVILYGIVRVIVQLFTNAFENTMLLTYLFLACAAIYSIYLLIGNYVSKKGNVEARQTFCNIGMLLATQLFFIWANAENLYSSVKNGQANILPWFFVFVTCVTSFFYRFRAFVIIYAINIVLTSVMIWGLGVDVHLTNTMYVNTTVFVIILIYIYVFKHFRELNDYKQRLMYEKQVEMNQLFSTSMNHELRTPLNSIIGNAQLLAMDGNLSEADAVTLKSIMHSGKTMLKIVDDILDCSKINAGEFRIYKKEFSLVELRDNVYMMMARLAEDKKLKYEVTIERGTPVSLLADSQRIQQIVLNIVSNGIKYTNQGSVEAVFSLENDRLKIVVTDTGIGMDEEALNNLYAPYRRFSEEDNPEIQGTGLGMFVVKHLLDRMGGHIDVVSKVGRGTKMTVDIPVTVADPALVYTVDMASQPVLEDEVKETPTYDFSGLTILAVDDTLSNRKLIEKLLARVGATVHSAENGLECLELLKTLKPDFILLDNIMPEMNGEECLNRIRKEQIIDKKVPIVMLTGTIDVETVVRFNQAGANDCLKKPVMADVLYETVRKYCKR